MFDTTDSIELISRLLPAREVDIIKLWRDLSERNRIAVLPIVEGAISFAKRSMYRNVQSLLNEQNSSISPLQALLITQHIEKAKTKGELDGFFRKAKIQSRQYQLSVIKPLSINSINVLIKLYQCISYDDAYLYVQVAKILRNYDLKKMVRQQHELTLAHENVANLLQWYRLARSMSKGFFEDRNEQTASKYPEDEKLYPSTDLVLATVNNAVAIIEEMRIFPAVILKMLRESQDMSGFFITVDALYMSLTNNFLGQEIKVRHKLALLYLVRDIIDDSAVWNVMTL